MGFGANRSEEGDIAAARALALTASAEKQAERDRISLLSEQLGDETKRRQKKYGNRSLFSNISGADSEGLTPGMRAALAYGNRETSDTPFEFTNSIARNPGGTFFQNGPVNSLFSSFFGEDNRSAIGDIWGALQLGKPISDDSWAKAGFGPGGTALSTPQYGSLPKLVRYKRSLMA